MMRLTRPRDYHRALQRRLHLQMAPPPDSGADNHWQLARSFGKLLSLPYASLELGVKVRLLSIIFKRFGWLQQQQQQQPVSKEVKG